MDLYSYSSTGQTDTLYSIEYRGLRSVDSVKFDWAYAMYSASYVDRLVVKVSKDGGETFPYTIFDRSGSTLATAPTTTAAFVPSGSSQWATFAYPLAGIVNSAEDVGVYPMRFELAQNYPNPFNPATLIEYSIPHGSNVRLEVCDVLGRVVATLVDGWKGAGRYSESFDASRLSSGVYLYRIAAGEFSSARKMAVVK